MKLIISENKYNKLFLQEKRVERDEGTEGSEEEAKSLYKQINSGKLPQEKIENYAIRYLNVIFSLIQRSFFLGEPMYFAFFNRYPIVYDTSCKCDIRYMNKTIEINPIEMSKYDLKDVENAYKIELIRLMLKHPFRDLPTGTGKEAAVAGSDCCISSGYKADSDFAKSMRNLGIYFPEQFNIEDGLSYNQYAKRIQDLINEKQNQQNGGYQSQQNGEGSNADVWGDGSEQNGNGQNQQNGNGQNQQNGEQQQQQNNYGSKADGWNADDANNQQTNGTSSNSQQGNESPIGGSGSKADGWGNDDLEKQEVNELIQNTGSWGSLAGNMQTQIEASMKAESLDLRKLINTFSGKLITTNKKLTRMRPSRRLGWEAEGYKQTYGGRCLICVDVSGSISEEQLNYFYGVINRTYRNHTGLEFDIAQFDAALGPIQPFKKRTNVEVTGRGGTSFKPIFNYLNEHPKEYDGVIIMTDGYADQIKDHGGICKAKVLWVCTNERTYNDGKDWMCLTGRVCVLSHEI